MGIARVEAVARELLDAGFPGDTPFAIVENGTRPGQRVLRGSLSGLPRVAAESEVRSPAILFVGRSAAPLSESPAERSAGTEVTA
jgi:uroporphyrin-III C-methyltransferase/precorrin-2 dehydrogenase/sirohydrochlorin ferrochelatase